MDRVLHLFAVVLVTVALVYRVRALRRRPDPGVRAMVESLVWLDIALVIGFLQLRLVDLLGVPALPQLVQHIAVLAAAFALAKFTLYLRLDDQEVGRRARGRLAVLVLGCTGLVVFYLLGPLPEGIPVINGVYGDRPFVLEYLTLYNIALGWALVDVAVSARVARHVPLRWLRRGLRLLTWGAAAGLLYVGHKAVYSAVRAFGGSLPWEEHGPAGIGTLIVLPAIVLLMAGVLVPPLGPVWDARRAYRALTPLWRALMEQAPELRFNRPTSTSESRAAARLRGRVVEIRDVLVGPLQMYLTPSLAERARALAAAQGLSGEALDIAAEAAVIAVALRLRSSGLPPLTATPAQFGYSDSADPDRDVARLVQLSRAFSTSPIANTLLEEVFADEQPAHH
ncbi:MULTISPECIES: MAB_1171c family putative transporter [unclassified Crossiella]|uniref:MAB_1171c family putative transporter n=1 Tax=unclassified Crossiella TaxID=2620835 RepID=UPI001FFFBD11|nr:MULTISPECIES: MAB_1171c family putative transporter [unclassified Crossiella]MCK2237731.1 hypothetical protein [Crossiella sp. S99.2]MCK2255017.1 hypothetical protein [Crossiella sp. S99.1]